MHKCQSSLLSFQRKVLNSTIQAQDLDESLTALKSHCDYYAEASERAKANLENVILHSKDLLKSSTTLNEDYGHLIKNILTVKGHFSDTEKLINMMEDTRNTSINFAAIDACRERN